jgi:bestrophin, other
MFFMTAQQRENFKEVVNQFKEFEKILPLSFVLGFFVSNVMTRWWDQYQSIPWPYSIAVYVSSTIKGYDEVGRCIRRTIMRYVCLSLTMVFRKLSGRVKRRFPLMKDMVDAGLLTKNELAIIENMDEKFPMYGKNWMPIVWAASLVNRARAEGRIADDYAVKTIIEALNSFRGSCGNLVNYNDIYIPLVYTQVVGIAVYFAFIVKLIAHQYIEDKGDLFVYDYFPVPIILEFIFYMGWLKVAETMLNPFGDDDDDFEVNQMIDHNLQVSYLIVDEMHNEHPELLKGEKHDRLLGQRF